MDVGGDGDLHGGAKHGPTTGRASGADNGVGDVFAGGGGGGGGARLTPGRGMGVKVDFGEEVGYVRYFPWTSRCEATCRRPGHTFERCRLTRYATESSGVGELYNEAMGRPLGLISAWFLKEFEGGAHEHNDPTWLHSFSYQERVDGRRHLSGLADGDIIQCFERPQRTGEPLEPFKDP